MARLLALVLIGWVAGVQMAIGYMAAPVLFAKLDKIMAGQLAGSMLTWAEVTGLIVMAAVSLLPQPPLHRGLLLVSMVGQLVQLAWLNPKMAALKATGLNDPLIQAQFLHWHGVSQVVFLVALVLLFVWLGLQMRQLSTDKQGL